MNYLKFIDIISNLHFTHPFIIHCDASQKGLGEVLYQKLNWEMKIISFVSLKLSSVQKYNHLHTRKLEFLALNKK